MSQAEEQLKPEEIEIDKAMAHLSSLGYNLSREDVIQVIRAFLQAQLAKSQEVCPEKKHTSECIRHKAFFGGVGCTCQGTGERTSPTIVCLCGSTRFVDTFNEWRKRSTLEGKIVLSIELVLPQLEREDPQHNNYKVKQALDELHLRKIDLADEVMILNVGGYIGESTRNELNYAKKLGKQIIYLEEIDGEN